MIEIIVKIKYVRNIQTILEEKSSVLGWTWQFLITCQRILLLFLLPRFFISEDFCVCCHTEISARNAQTSLKKSKSLPEILSVKRAFTFIGQMTVIITALWNKKPTYIVHV